MHISFPISELRISKYLTTISKMSMCETQVFLQYLTKLLHVLLVDRMLQEEEESFAVTV